MQREWINQTITTVKHWHSHYSIADWFAQQLTPSRLQLDKHLAAVEPYKHDQTTTVARLEFAQSTLVLKRYNPRSFVHTLKRALRRSRAQRCWDMSYVFAKAGLNVAAPVFMFEDRLGLICKNAYFANQFLPGLELLEALPVMSSSERAKVVQELKHAMCMMQQHRISHGDMKASNLLWVDERLFFIDLDAARKHSTNMSWRNANRRDCRRFLKNWCNQPDLLKLFAWLEKSQ